MRKIIIPFVFAILFASLISADILIQQQPEKLYNLGEEISFPVVITTGQSTSGFIDAELLCGGFSKKISQGLISLNTENGYRVTKTIIIPLKKEFIGNLQGNCEIRILFKNEQPKLTDDFKVSNFIKIDYPITKVEFKPGESVVIDGKATKESGQPVTGFIELSIISDVTTINLTNTVNNGYFSINFSLSENMPAGKYLTKIKVYEKEETGETTNSGFIDYNILVTQIPTNLEIVFGEKEVEPGTNLQIKAILHDQSGEQIKSVSIITIKDEENNILEQTNKATDEFLEYLIKYNEPPAEWKIFAVSNQLTSEATFKIKEKHDVKTELINQTLLVTNIGNVPYNDTLLIKIGDKSVSLNIILGVDESEKYALSAPDGQYKVEVVSDSGNKISGNVMLTGKAVEVKKTTEGIITFVRHPLIWLFVIAILGFVVFIIYKKGYQRSFVGYIDDVKSKKKDSSYQPILVRGDSIITPVNKAELSLSIKGENQNTAVVCLNIKNLREIKTQRGGAKEILERVINVAEENKATTYENQGYFFFLLAPTVTKTFKNEKNALKIAERIKNVLIDYNRLAKQKIDFGISMNYGAIVAKKEGRLLKFMSMGTLITAAKKIASVSDKEVLLAEKMKEKLMTDVKTEKEMRGNVPVYVIKEIKGEPREDNQKFIDGFLRRLGEK